MSNVQELEITHEGSLDIGLTLMSAALREILARNITDEVINSFIVVEHDGAKYAVGYDPEVGQVQCLRSSEFDAVPVGTYLVVHSAASGSVN